MQTQSVSTRFVVKLIGLSVLLAATGLSSPLFALTSKECDERLGRLVTRCQSHNEGYTVCKDYCQWAGGDEPITAIQGGVKPAPLGVTKPTDPGQAKPDIAPVPPTPGISMDPGPRTAPPGVKPEPTQSGELEVFSSDGRKYPAKVQGDRLMIISMNNWLVAPDGTYRNHDGKKIVVQGGVIVKNEMGTGTGVKALILPPKPVPPRPTGEGTGTPKPKGTSTGPAH